MKLHYLNFGVVSTQVYYTVLIVYLACKHNSCYYLNRKPFNSLIIMSIEQKLSLFNLCISNRKRVMKMETTMVDRKIENISQYQN